MDRSYLIAVWPTGGTYGQYYGWLLWLVGWLVGRLTSPFNTKIGYIADKDLGEDLILSG